ncbi:hypothetical protein F5Y16DRAFT_13477 [Xylariaceae sp. FL0255]|nr:hypothetical protein F5Y16DRAFT_13477 [Xylariaceae sp. FL0255]
METLRQLADIPQERFKPRPHNPHHPHVITYVHTRIFSTAQPPEFSQLGADEVTLMSKLVSLEQRVANNSTIAASLTLVSMGRDQNENILVSRMLFTSVFRQFGIDARFLQLIKTNRYGLHYDWDAEGERVSYYVGTALYSLMWTFDRKTRTTKAILLSRDVISSKELGSLAKLLKLESRRLYSPFLLAWVSLVHLSNWMDSSTYHALTRIRHLEELTGYGPYGQRKAAGEVPIDDLTQASKDVGWVQVNLANQIRHVTIGTAIATHFSTRAPKITDYATGPFVTPCQQELEAFNETIPSLQRSLNDSSAYVDYLQERVRSQNTVVYALMTREDARTNIQLATAAKMDSASMKTIAILTMLFLPGTYFAALWAVPSLQWEPVQNEFWWYWAFTLPSTFLIFVIWFGLHKWAYHRAAKLKSGKRKNGSEGYEKLDEPTTSPFPTPPIMSLQDYTQYSAPLPRYEVPTSAPPSFASDPFQPQVWSAPAAEYDAPPPLPYAKPWVAPPNTDVRDFAAGRNQQPTSAPAGYFE